MATNKGNKGNNVQANKAPKKSVGKIIGRIVVILIIISMLATYCLSVIGVFN